MKLHGPLGALFGVAFVALWVYAMFCGLMVFRNNNSKSRWFSKGFWPASSLTPEGLRYRRRYYITVLLALTLVGLAFLVLPK